MNKKEFILCLTLIIITFGYIICRMSNSIEIVQCTNPDCIHYIETTVQSEQTAKPSDYVIQFVDVTSSEEIKNQVLFSAYEPVYEESIPPEPDDVVETFIPLDVKLSVELQEHVFNVSQDYDVPFTVLMALAFRESSYRTDVVAYNKNGTTDSGLMQINSCNWDWLYADLGLDVVNSPYDNIEAAAYILSEFCNQYTLEEALTAYNMGESNMLKYRTSKFADRVLSLSAEYDEQLLNGGD